MIYLERQIFLSAHVSISSASSCSTRSKKSIVSNKPFGSMWVLLYSTYALFVHVCVSLFHPSSSTKVCLFCFFHCRSNTNAFFWLVCTTKHICIRDTEKFIKIVASICRQYSSGKKRFKRCKRKECRDKLDRQATAKTEQYPNWNRKQHRIKSEHNGTPAFKLMLKLETKDSVEC